MIEFIFCSVIALLAIWVACFSASKAIGEIAYEIVRSIYGGQK